MKQSPNYERNEYDEVIEMIFLNRETVSPPAPLSKGEFKLNRNQKLSLSDKIIIPLMVGALITGIGQSAVYFFNVEIESFDPRVVLCVISFFPFVLRFLIGNIQYNLVSRALGVNDIKSNSKLLRWKAFCGNVSIFMHSILFIYLGFCISSPSLYLFVFFVIISFDSMWLGYENRCLTRTFICKSRKQFNSEEREREDIFTSKIGTRAKLQEVTGIWLENNWFFAVLTSFCLFLSFYGVIGCIYVGLVTSIFNSFVDLRLTLPFYKDPYDFVEGFK